MKEYKNHDIFTHDDYLKTCANFPEEENAYITETAGFIPLEVKLKQFEQNGIAAQFNTAEFTSSDYREMYLNPDFDITPEDDLEDVQEKINARNIFIKEFKRAKSTGSDEKPVTVEQKEEKPIEEKTK